MLLILIMILMSTRALNHRNSDAINGPLAIFRRYYMSAELRLINSIIVSRSHLVYKCVQRWFEEASERPSNKSSRCQKTAFVRSDLKHCGGLKGGVTWRGGRCPVRHAPSLQRCHVSPCLLSSPSDRALVHLQLYLRHLPFCR